MSDQICPRCGKYTSVNGSIYTNYAHINWCECEKLLWREATHTCDVALSADDYICVSHLTKEQQARVKCFVEGLVK